MTLNTRKGRWLTVDDLGGGGQGQVFLARDTERCDFDKDIWPLIRRAVQGVVSIGSEPSVIASARQLAEALERYLIEKDAGQHSALKVIRPEVIRDISGKARLNREIQVLQMEIHPNVIRLIDASQEEGWFVMNYYPMGNLGKAENKLLFKGDPLGALKAFRPLVEAVAALHKQGIVHRDIKPENIFVSVRGLVLGDFGLVHFDDDSATRVSETYENVGSRDWMPGWAMGMRVEDVKPSFDTFCLGKVLWAMVSGKTKLPLWYFSKPQHDLAEQFPADERIRWINRILQGCVVEEESACFPSASELLDGIEEIIEILRRGGQVLRKEIDRYCQVCGHGRYMAILNETTSTAAIHNFGLVPVGVPNWRIYRCTYCGHIQFFRDASHGPAWGERPL